MQDVSFLVNVQGSAKNAYEIKVYEEGSELSMKCSCPAGARSDKFCKHLSAVLVGDITNVVSGIENIETLKDLAAGTPLLAQALQYHPKKKVGQIPTMTLKDVFQKYMAEFEKLGWYAEYHEEGEPEFRKTLSLFGCYKNGNKRKSPTYTLEHADLVASEFIFDAEKGYVPTAYKPKVKPWSYKSITYQHLDLPLERFLSDAHQGNCC